MVAQIILTLKSSNSYKQIVRRYGMMENMHWFPASPSLQTCSKVVVARRGNHGWSLLRDKPAINHFRLVVSLPIAIGSPFHHCSTIFFAWDSQVLQNNCGDGESTELFVAEVLFLETAKCYKTIVLLGGRIIFSSGSAFSLPLIRMFSVDLLFVILFAMP